MKIRDYDLIDDINPLFEKKIIIYGTGKYGKKTAQLMVDAGVSGEYCFCDCDENRKEYLGYSVITLDELEVTVKQGDCIIVVCSENHCEEMIEELERRIIDAYVCTWYGVKAGIEVNINDTRFSETFRRDFVQRKELFLALNKVTTGGSTEVAKRMLVDFPEFLIYQPGKVGSSTVYETLVNEGLSAAQVHVIVQNTKIEETKRIAEYYTEVYRKYKKHVKIITCVREPIIRQLSYFVQTFTQNFIRATLLEDLNLAENAVRFMVNGLDINKEFVWFDEEIKELTGVDIYQYPFDKEKGYTLIKEGNIEILVMTLEQLNDNVKVLGDFVGKPSLKLCNSNVADEKHNKYIYKELKERIKLPARVLDSQYRDNPKLDHFYTEEHKKQFYQKWNKYVI